MHAATFRMLFSCVPYSNQKLVRWQWFDAVISKLFDAVDVVI